MMSALLTLCTDGFLFPCHVCLQPISHQCCSLRPLPEPERAFKCAPHGLEWVGMNGWEERHAAIQTCGTSEMDGMSMQGVIPEQQRTGAGDRASWRSSAESGTGETDGRFTR